MSSDSGSAENGTTNLIEDWGPDPWGIDWGLWPADPGSADPGSNEPPVTYAEQMLQRAESGHLVGPVLLGVFRGNESA